MIQICPSNHCTGCAACANICPKQCIKMIEDSKLGHFIPNIDQEKCVDCGLCQKTCPQNSESDYRSPLQCFAAWEKDEGSYRTSSSVGAASAFSRKILQEGGVVYGCAVQQGTVKHIRVIEEKDLVLLKGSKYVQSLIEEQLLVQVKKDLQQGLNVLFIGTPCQIDGVRSFLKIKHYQNLYLVDIVCHGVPSSFLFHSYLQKKLGKNTEIGNIKFRDNTSYVLSVYGKNQEIIYSRKMQQDLFYVGFMRRLLFRDSCYQCRYARKERISDITIGDFWGIGSLHILKKPKNGLSLILVNSEQGSSLLDKVSESFYVEERTVDEAVAGNKQLRFPSHKHFARGLFCELYKRIGFEASAKIALFIDRIAYSILLRKK